MEQRAEDTADPGEGTLDLHLQCPREGHWL